jgi:hypothetical protein
MLAEPLQSLYKVFTKSFTPCKPLKNAGEFTTYELKAHGLLIRRLVDPKDINLRDNQAFGITKDYMSYTHVLRTI